MVFVLDLDVSGHIQNLKHDQAFVLIVEGLTHHLHKPRLGQILVNLVDEHALDANLDFKYFVN